MLNQGGLPLATTAMPETPAGRLAHPWSATALLRGMTSSATTEDVHNVLKGRTEKPGGVDPTRLYGSNKTPAGLELRRGRIPLALVASNECADRYDGTVIEEIAASYTERSAETQPPVILLQPVRRSSCMLLVLDGGHRITASRRRADTLIDAFVRIENPEREAARLARPSQWRLLPAERAAEAAIGDWACLPYPDLRGTPVAQLRLLAPEDLFLPELDEGGRLQPEKRADLPSYTARAAAGDEPPAATAVEMEDGRTRVVDGHRRSLAARAAGRLLKVWVSPLMHAPGLGLVPATAEMLGMSVTTAQPHEWPTNNPFVAPCEDQEPPPRETMRG